MVECEWCFEDATEAEALVIEYRNYSWVVHPGRCEVRMWDCIINDEREYYFYNPPTIRPYIQEKS